MLTTQKREALNRQLLEGSDSAPGRVRTSRIYPERNLPPHSCALTKYDNNLYRLLVLCSRDLRGGCGEKVILDDYLDPKPCQFNWAVYLDPNHPDFHLATPDQRERMKTLDPWDGEWLKVGDSMEEEFSEESGLVSIEDSWGKFIELAIAGKNIWVDLSRLRPHGTMNDKGLMASGPIGRGVEGALKTKSFFSIYEAIANHLLIGDVGSLLVILGTINDTLRQGGHKRGIITTSMRWDNPHFRDYLGFPTAIIPGSHKKGVRLTHKMFLHDDLVEQVAQAANDEGVFLIKVQPEKPVPAILQGHQAGLDFRQTTGNELTDHVPADPKIFPEGIKITEPLDNVCVGLKIRHRGTCLIWRVNYGQCGTFEDVEVAYENAMRNLVMESISWRKRVGKKADIYLPVEEDRQVGLCLMGVANALAYWKIKYRDFNDAIARFLNGKAGGTEADRLVFHIARGYQKAGWLADQITAKHNLPAMERLFTVEPGQNHPYDCVDLQGFTCARGIWAPYYNRERRDSEHQKNVSVRFGKTIETARDLGPDFHQQFTENWQLFMTVCSGGRAHTISFDTQKPITPDWLKNSFMPSFLETKYYSEHETYDQSHLRKRTVVAVCGLRADECSVCAE